MGSLVVVRYRTTDETTDENRRLVEAVYAELAESRPAGLRYGTLRLADGVSYLHVAVTEGETSPLPGLASFQEFQRGIGERVAAPPERLEPTVIGSYRLFTE
jgi:hypothetical protein